MTNGSMSGMPNGDGWRGKGDVGQIMRRIVLLAHALPQVYCATRVYCLNLRTLLCIVFLRGGYDTTNVVALCWCAKKVQKYTHTLIDVLVYNLIDTTMMWFIMKVIFCVYRPVLCYSRVAHSIVHYRSYKGMQLQTK